MKLPSDNIKENEDSEQNESRNCYHSYFLYVRTDQKKKMKKNEKI